MLTKTNKKVDQIQLFRSRLPHFGEPPRFAFNFILNLFTS
jgi:hypothetical protein